MDDKKKSEAIRTNGIVEAQETDEKSNDKFPCSIIFIIGNEFCERFCYYGLRAVLTLYFLNVLNYTKNEATEGYHLFVMFAYFTPLLGAFIADSYLGKYQTILYLSVVYVIGNILLSTASYLISNILTVTGLALIALGTGGIKPCVSSFGGDQFKKNQMHLLDKFFSLFYLSINLGSLVSMFITPIFRSDISCFGQSSCYPLAFGVPALLMIVALILFLVGTPFYVRSPPAKGNVVVQFVSCVIYSIYKKITNIFSSSQKPAHFLDYSSDKYSSNLIQDSKSVLSLFLLYIPLPIFWSLYDQQGSTFVLQADHTDGDISFWNWKYTLRSDQFQVMNPLMVVLMIPLFEYVIYPVLRKMNLCTKPLQKMSLGLLLAALSFFCASLLELSIESSKLSAPTEGQTNINLILLSSKPIQTIDLLATKMTNLNKINDLENRFIDFGTIPIDSYTLNAQFSNGGNYSQILNLEDQKAYTIMIYEKNDKLNHSIDENEIKTDYANIQLQIYFNQEKYLKKAGDIKPYEYITIKDSKDQIVQTSIINSIPVFSIPKAIKLNGISDTYDVLIDNKKIFKFKGEISKSYKLIILAKEGSGFETTQYEWLNFKQVSILWQLIQYTVITASEICLSITGLAFSYSEAPVSMKSVVTAAWLFTTALGNFFVVVITSLVHFESQAMQFFFYGLLMALDLLIFVVLAYLYKPRNQDDDNQSEGTLDKRNGTGSIKLNDLKKSDLN